jgi:hypothetical protein
MDDSSAFYTERIQRKYHISFIGRKGNAFILCYTKTINMRFLYIFSAEINPYNKEEVGYEQR